MPTEPWILQVYVCLKLVTGTFGGLELLKAVGWNNGTAGVWRPNAIHGDPTRVWIPGCSEPIGPSSQIVRQEAVLAVNYECRVERGYQVCEFFLILKILGLHILMTWCSDGIRYHQLPFLFTDMMQRPLAVLQAVFPWKVRSLLLTTSIYIHTCT
jgi:hypothetical protein